MKRVLITGASGILGSQVLAQLDKNAYQVRVLQHRRTAQGQSDLEVVNGDLATGEGLAEAVKEVDTIIHLISGFNSQKLDVPGTARLVKLAREAGVKRIIYQSIVGIDRAPISYYKGKLATEEVIRASGLEWTIFRATQFHQLLDILFSALNRLPVLLVPRKVQCQPVDPSEVAARLVAALANGTTGFLPELGGPQTSTLGELVETWKAARGSHKPVINLPLPGKGIAALRKGYNTTTFQTGQISWQTWLEQRYHHQDSRLTAKGL